MRTASTGRTLPTGPGRAEPVHGAILVLNAGSSSLKWARFGSGADSLVQLASGQADVNDPTPEAFARALDGVMRQATSEATPLVAVRSHRVFFKAAEVTT